MIDYKLSTLNNDYNHDMILGFWGHGIFTAISCHCTGRRGNELSNIIPTYPLVNVYITMENHHAING